MIKKVVDRRILRSRASLQRALNSLISKKGYEAITIKEICEAANVGRSTFYTHYTSKDDLKRSGFEPLRKLLFERQSEAISKVRPDGSHRFGFSLAMFEHALDHKDHYKALIGGRGGAISLGSIRKILSDLVRAESNASAKKSSTDAIPHELVVQFVVGAFMAVMTWWLDGGAKLAPQQIDAMFRSLAIEGMPLSFAATPRADRS